MDGQRRLRSRRTGCTCRRSWRRPANRQPTTLRGDPPAAGARWKRRPTRGGRSGSHRFDTRRWARALAAAMQGRAGRDRACSRSADVRRDPHAARTGGDAGRRAACRRTRASEDRGGIEQPGAAGGASWRRWSTTSSTTARAICWRSATTSTSVARDQSYYDLLASEARLCSFVAIAQGQLPQENWFALGRLLINGGGEPCCCPGAARCSST